MMALNSGALQADDPGLHAAASRYFGSYDAALQAAKINPARVRRRIKWDKKEVLAAIQAAAKAGQSLSDSAIRRQSPALYGASTRLFGTFVAARKAAGVPFRPGKRRKPAK